MGGASDPVQKNPPSLGAPFRQTGRLSHCRGGHVPLDRLLAPRLWSPGRRQSRTAFRLLAWPPRASTSSAGSSDAILFLSLAGSPLLSQPLCLRAQFAPPESSFYWHLPLGVLVVWYCLTGDYPSRAPTSPFFCGGSCPARRAEYLLPGDVPSVSGRHLLLSRLAPGALAANRLPTLLAAVAVFAVGLMNVRSLSSRLANGPNPFVIVRNYARCEALRLETD